jgi:nucleotidyltransferase/DNA polymerase involved in DNA repair
MAKGRKHPLLSLRSVGPASLRDMESLDIHTVEELAGANPQDMYDRLCALTGQKVDICQYDVFCCAVEQAQNPRLPDEQKEWHWWSRRRLSVQR